MYLVQDIDDELPYRGKLESEGDDPDHKVFWRERD